MDHSAFEHMSKQEINAMEEVVKKLNKMARTRLTVEHYLNWWEVEDEKKAKQFDNAVKKLLGKNLYDQADYAARLDGALLRVLGISAGSKHENDFIDNLIKADRR